MINQYLRERKDLLDLNTKVYFNDFFIDRGFSRSIIFVYIIMMLCFIYYTNFINTSNEAYVSAVANFLYSFLGISIFFGILKFVASKFNAFSFNEKYTHFQIKIRAKQKFEKESMTTTGCKFDTFSIVVYNCLFFLLLVFSLTLRHKAIYPDNFLDIDNIRFFEIYLYTQLVILTSYLAYVFIKFHKFNDKISVSIAGFFGVRRETIIHTKEFEKTIEELIVGDPKYISEINDILLNRSSSNEEVEAVSDLFNIIKKKNEYYEELKHIHKENEKTATYMKKLYDMISD